MPNTRDLDGRIHPTVLRKLLPIIVATSACVPATSVLAQSGICYMVGTSGQVVNLNGLCGVAPPSPKPAAGSATANPNRPGVHRIKIKRREAGTPVIDVRFNGSQTFEMIVDTGASSTVLTTRMASLLRVVPVGVAQVDTASQKGVEVPLGYVNSIEVAGAKAQNLLVAVAGPNLDIGLLGQDFFKDYDVVIRQDAIEFHHR